LRVQKSAGDLKQTQRTRPRKQPMAQRADL
jgi:hypothetical protein